MQDISIFSSKTYIDQLERHTKTKHPEKSIIERVWQENLFKIKSKGDFLHKVKGYIATIASVKPGRILFKRLLALSKGRRIVIRECEVTYLAKWIFLDITRTPYYVTKEQRLFKTSPMLALAHEMLHLLHFFENAKQFWARRDVKSKESFENLEEQYTITGILDDKTPVALCENAFLHALQMPLRIHHEGIHLEKGEPLGLMHFLLAKAYGDIDDALKKDPQLVQELIDVDSRTKLYPLSIAAMMGDTELCRYLLDRGAKIDAVDDGGGASQTAFRNEHFKTWKFLDNYAPSSCALKDVSFKFCMRSKL